VPTFPPSSSLLDAVEAAVEVSGKWNQWRTDHPALAAYAGASDLLAERSPVPTREVRDAVAALVALASRRGGDDDDASLFVVAMLEPGLRRLLKRELRGVPNLGVADLQLMAWREVKAAIPTPGASIGAFLLRRTRRAAGLTYRAELERSQVEVSYGELPSTVALDRGNANVAVREWSDTAAGRLADLLAWAQESGVVSAADVELLYELVDVGNDLGMYAGAGVSVKVASRHGVAKRTVDRRRERIVGELRAVAGEYLLDAPMSA